MSCDCAVPITSGCARLARGARARVASAATRPRAQPAFSYSRVSEAACGGRGPWQHGRASAAVVRAGNGGGPDPRPRTLKGEAEESNRETYDRLIEVFVERDPREYQKLIAYSKQWPTLAEGVFARLKERARQEEDENSDHDAAIALLRCERKLRMTHEAVRKYKGMVSIFFDEGEEQWEGLVARFRRELTADFFEYMRGLVGTCRDDEAQRDRIIHMATRLLAICEAADAVAEEEGALTRAAEDLQGLLEAQTLGEADAKIDALAAEGRLDPALLMTMAKAYSSSRDSDLTSDDAKEIMAHLYFKAKEAAARQQPPEVRILKHLLSMEDRRDRLNGLDEAFTPAEGGEGAGPDLALPAMPGATDQLSTTPQRLLTTVDAVLGAYERGLGAQRQSEMGQVMAGAGVTQQGPAGMLGDAAAMMDPVVIARLREIQEDIKKQYL